MIEWEKTTLGKICEDSGGNIQTGPFGSQLHASDYVPVGIPSIMPQNIGDNRVMINGIARITDADAKKLSRYLVKSGDIVYSRRGDVERRALIRETEEGWLCGTGCLRVRFGDKKPISPTFISYYLNAPNIRMWIVQHAVGATMPNLNTTILSDVPVLLPPYHEQKAIADVLSALDDRIELNRQMNQTLEATAQALFKSWFVGFDPVKDKAEGRRPEGMDDVIAAVFPSSFTDSPLGLIPESWEVKEIGELVDAMGGATPDTKESSYWDNGTISWVTPKDLSSISSHVLLDTERKINEKGLAKIGSGLLPVGTVLLSSRAPIGYLVVSEIPVAINQGFIAMKPKGVIGTQYILYWTLENMEIIKGRANGSTFQEISKKSFRPILTLLPQKEILYEFERIAGILHARVVENLKQINRLILIRDTLLSKLISGKLRVSDLPKETTAS